VTPPLVSVVTPSWNQGRFLADAIESVAVQDYPRLEHLIVEGGSTDESGAVLQRYGGLPHLRVLEERPRRGQSHAVNLGFREARGEVVGWLNADDRYLPGAVRSAVGALAEAPEVLLVYGNWEEIDEHGAVIAGRRAGRYDVRAQLDGVNAVVAQPTVFFLRELLERIGYLDETLHYAMDFELWLRASRVTELRWVDETWAQFRLHPASKSGAEYLSFWPEARRVARAYGGPFFSRGFRNRYLNAAFAKEVGGRALRRLGLRDAR
jgi:glycosyltransferase involved in cell wall biosynthesis